MERENDRTILTLEGVGKRFGGLVATDNVTFDLKSGEILGLIGPNGAGKTTLLNLISGIYDADEGKIMIGEKDVTHVASHDRARLHMARTFQTPRFLTKASIRDNMLLGTDLAEQKGFWKSFVTKQSSMFDEEVRFLLDKIDFHLDWDDDISSLPYGHQKLLEIVRALLTHPKIMLVDEPAAGLNSKEIDLAISLLHYARDKLGVGVILIEHSMDMIMNVCDRIVVLNFGKVIAKGTPKEVSRNKDVIEAYLGRDYNAAD